MSRASDTSILEYIGSTNNHPGHQPEVQHQQVPGLQSKLDPAPQVDHVPTPDGGSELYKAAGKLKDRRALITGGDSGIGRSIAVLFAMEGADSFIVYLPEEEKDAQETKKLVEKKGRKCYLYSTDLKDQKNCKKVVDEAVKQLGGIDILVNNAAYQMMVEDIKDLSEYVIMPELSSSSRQSNCFQGTMDSYLRHQHSSLFLPLKILPPTHEEGQHHHQQRFYQRLHWPT